MVLQQVNKQQNIMIYRIFNHGKTPLIRRDVAF